VARKIIVIIIVLLFLVDGTQLFCKHADDYEHKLLVCYLFQTHSNNHNHSKTSSDSEKREDPFHKSCHYNRLVKTSQVHFSLDCAGYIEFADYMIPSLSDYSEFLSYHPKIPDKLYVWTSVLII